jgi:hypothetical protein
MIKIIIVNENFRYYESSSITTITLKKINFTIEVSNQNYFTLFLTKNNKKLDYYYGT